jgi:hypothetical protein
MRLCAIRKAGGKPVAISTSRQTPRGDLCWTGKAAGVFHPPRCGRGEAITHRQPFDLVTGEVFAKLGE